VSDDQHGNRKTPDDPEQPDAVHQPAPPPQRRNGVEVVAADGATTSTQRDARVQLMTASSRDARELE
jgi:hypothetical protein